MSKYSPRTLIPQCFAEPNNTFQVQNERMFLDILIALKRSFVAIILVLSVFLMQFFA